MVSKERVFRRRVSDGAATDLFFRVNEALTEAHLSPDLYAPMWDYAVNRVLSVTAATNPLRQSAFDRAVGPCLSEICSAVSNGKLESIFNIIEGIIHKEASIYFRSHQGDRVGNAFSIEDSEEAYPLE